MVSLIFLGGTQLSCCVSVFLIPNSLKESPFRDKLKHQKRCLEASFFLECMCIMLCSHFNLKQTCLLPFRKIIISVWIYEKQSSFWTDLEKVAHFVWKIAQGLSLLFALLCLSVDIKVKCLPGKDLQNFDQRKSYVFRYGMFAKAWQIWRFSKGNSWQEKIYTKKIFSAYNIHHIKTSNKHDFNSTENRAFKKKT